MPKSPAIMASGISTIFLQSDPNEQCRIILLLQEKRTGKNSNIFNEEIVATIDNLLEYKSITPSEHQIVFKKVIYCTKKKSKTG